jgi:cytochrome c-type biogenesis protein CcmH
MDGDGYRPVRLPSKATDRAALTPLERDAVERRISCPCPCTLDIFTCRTSMPCGFAPRMHQDVIALVEGGYSGDEILAAFVAVYGEEARMAPPKKGFNLLGWVAPFAAIAAGGVALTIWLRRERKRSDAVVAPAPLDGVSEEELKRLEQAVKSDG